MTVESTLPTITLSETDDSTYSTIAQSFGYLQISADAGNTGAGDGITFKVDNSEAARITSDGNLGIGTTSPQKLLHVSDLSGSAQIMISSSDSGVASLQFSDAVGGSVARGYIEYDNSTNHLALGTGALERLRVDSSGNVGIGTTSPFSKLHVGSRGSASVLSYGSSGDGIVFDFYNLAGSPYTRYANIVSSSSDTSESRLGLWTQAASGTSSEKLTILGDGNVGIGQTSPQAGLDLGSSAKGTWSSGNTYHIPSGNAYIKVQGTAAQDNWIGITGGYDQSSGSANLLLQANIRLVNEQAGNYISSEAQSSTSADITFGKMVGGSTTSGNSTKSEFMRIDSSGNLLVGKTATDDFTVVGTQIDADGFIAVTRDGSVAALFNRETSDGDILQFRKDNTTIGSIGVANANNLLIESKATDHTGLEFGNDILPRRNAAVVDNQTNLGTSSYRFANLHSSNIFASSVGIGTTSPTTQVTASQSANISQVAITSSSNAVAWNATAAANAYHVTTENTTFSAPSNAVEGAIISVEIAQGGTARTVAWNTVFEFAASTAPTVTATANKTDIFSFRYNGSVWQEIGRVQNMAQT